MVQRDTVTRRRLQSLIHQEINEAVYCSNLTEGSEDNNEEGRRDMREGRGGEGGRRGGVEEKRGGEGGRGGRGRRGEEGAGGRGGGGEDLQQYDGPSNFVLSLFILNLSHPQSVSL